jgi:hypothetical protein
MAKNFKAKKKGSPPRNRPTAKVVRSELESHLPLSPVGAKRTRISGAFASDWATG